MDFWRRLRNTCLYILQRTTFCGSVCGMLHSQFITSEPHYRRDSRLWLPPPSSVDGKLPRYPARAIVVAVEFTYDTPRILKVKPKVLSITPLERGEPVASLDCWNVRGRTPGSGVRAVDSISNAIAPVNLGDCIVENDSTKRGLSHCFARIGVAFREFQLQPGRRDCTRPIN